MIKNEENAANNFEEYKGHSYKLKKMSQSMFAVISQGISVNSYTCFVQAFIHLSLWAHNLNIE